MPATYRAAAPETLRRVELDELTAIFHRASRITHLVASPVPELLQALTDPQTIDQLIAQLRAAFELPDVDEAAFSARLEELVAAGLVERR